MPNNRDVFWDDLDKRVSGDLKNKVAVITGGGKGIGRAIVQNFLKNGATIIILTRSSGENVAAGNDNCFRVTCDVRKFSQVKLIMENIVAAHGHIDILVNAAGIALLTPVKQETEELYDSIMDTNFKGVRNCIVATAAYIEQTKGCIINIGSIWGMPGINLVGDATYSAADAAIIKYSEIIAAELPSARCNCISPALVETSMNDDMTTEEKNEFMRGYPDRNTLLQPAEIAEVAEYIAKSDINQKNIIIDGGYLSNT